MNTIEEILRKKNENIFEAFLIMFSETVYAIIIRSVGLEHILFILGIVFLVFGLIINEDNLLSQDNKNLVIKYKLLRVLGYLPFIGIVCFAIYEGLFGFSFLGDTSYGFVAFLCVIGFYSFLIWPIYIIGIILIIKSSKIFSSNHEVYTK